jgi:hypothetical protein
MKREFFVSDDVGIYKWHPDISISIDYYSTCLLITYGYTTVVCYKYGLIVLKIVTILCVINNKEGVSIITNIFVKLALIPVSVDYDTFNMQLCCSSK